MSEPEDLRGPILLTALALLALDAIVVFLLSGGIAQLMRWRRPATAATLALLFLGAAIIGAPQAFAQNPVPPRVQELLTGPGGTSRAPTPVDEQSLKSTLETRLAYVITGDPEVDRISKAGLQGLTLFLAQRTALEAGEPIGLDPARDEPVLSADLLASRAERAAFARRPRAYDAYEAGGTVLFRGREAPPGPNGATRGPGMQAPQHSVLADIPELEPVRRDHADQDILPAEGLPRPFQLGQL